MLFRLASSAFLARLRQDPTFGVNTPYSCDGLFDPAQTGPYGPAANMATQRRILAQMIPNRTLPAGGTGGSGDGLAEIRPLVGKYLLATSSLIVTIDMNGKGRNGWPQVRLDDALKFDRWLHGDLIDLALPYTFAVTKEGLKAGERRSNQNKAP